MVKAEFCYFSRGTDLQKLATAKRTNGFLADNQIWEAQGPWFSEIYVCKSPQGGGGFRYLARGLFCVADETLRGCSEESDMRSTKSIFQDGI